MAKKATKRAPKKKTNTDSKKANWRKYLRWICAGVVFCIIAVFIVLRFVPLPTTPYIASEKSELGSVHFEWVSIEEMSDTVKLAVVAAEDVNFCQHWGFDMTAIRAAIEDGGNRGASTLTQQVVKNTFLWHGRSWTRKTFEAFFTPLVELFWSKQRILEVYLNVAEFDKGVFGVEAASLHYFGISSDSLTLAEAARLAAILPDPKGRSASSPTQFVLDRADNIQDGAVLIQKDQRSHCFMD